MALQKVAIAPPFARHAPSASTPATLNVASLPLVLRHRQVPGTAALGPLARPGGMLNHGAGEGELLAFGRVTEAEFGFTHVIFAGVDINFSRKRRFDDCRGGATAFGGASSAGERALSASVGALRTCDVASRLKPHCARSTNLHGCGEQVGVRSRPRGWRSEERGAQSLKRGCPLPRSEQAGGQQGARGRASAVRFNVRRTSNRHRSRRRVSALQARLSRRVRARCRADRRVRRWSRNIRRA